MSSKQLIDIILNLYDARKDAREYFEFFLNPDFDALLEQKSDLVIKEVRRSKYGYSKFRISVIKQIIKDVESFGALPEVALKFRVWCIAVLVASSRMYYYTDAQDNSIMKLATENMDFADRNNLFDQIIVGYNEIITHEPNRDLYLSGLLINVIEDYEPKFRINR